MSDDFNGLDVNVTTAIDDYYEHGHDAGSFAMALINQDFKEAVLAAHENLTTLSIILHMGYAEKKAKIAYEELPKSITKIVNGRKVKINYLGMGKIERDRRENAITKILVDAYKRNKKDDKENERDE